MTALYNEIDRNAAAWLRQLIIAGHIAPGVVDERDIRDLEPEYVASFTQCHFFAGIGVWSHALRLAGWPDDRPIWTGSCPCQPFSAAGKGGGFDDERHLWPAFHHLIEQCRPDIVLGEQVASKDGLAWLDLVHADLEGADYAVGAVDTCAAGFGAPHIRQRLWWVGRAGRAVGDVSVEPREWHAGGLSGAQAQVSGEDRQQHGHRAVGLEYASSGVVRLADALDPVGRADLSTGHDRYWPHAGRPQDSGDVGAGRGLFGLADRASGGRREELPVTGGGLVGDRAERLSARPVDGGCDYAMGLSHPAAGQPHPIPAPELGADHPDRLDDDHSDGARQAVGGVHLGRSQPDGSQLRPGPTNGFWASVDWLHCRDGKWRPVEPGTFPLSHGTPARVGRLRGYGNAIVAPAAEGFIAAVMEAVS